jgi:hypothetical protein
MRLRATLRNDKNRKVILNEAWSGLYYVATMILLIQDFET